MKERIRTVSNHQLSTLVQHSYTNMTNTRFLCIQILKEIYNWSWIKILGKKRSFRFDSFKILFFCVCEKWSVIFVISKFFLLADVLKRSAIADKHPLFATLLTPPMLITAFLHFWHKGHWEPCNDVGPLSPAKLLMGFELGMFWFWLQFLNLLGHPPQIIHII